jgi:threonine dehydrogenase-like Zn-dependent dehydrogenase
MKALVYLGPEELEYRDEPDAEPRDGETLVRVDSVGICGSDMHAFLGHDDRRPAPLILGHEAAGVVVSGAETGRRVTINPLVTCGACEYCESGRNNLCIKRQIISMPPRQGAFAQFVAMPPENLVTIPDGVSFEKAALAEPLACGWHAVRLAMRNQAIPIDQAKCAVIGGGAIGLGAALALSANGARNIFIAETNAIRHPALRDAGPFVVYDPRAGEPLGDSSAHIVIEAVGFAGTREMACRLVRPGGTIAHIGLGDSSGGLDIRRMTLQEITFFGTYTYTPEDFRETARAIFEGRMGSLDWPEIRSLSQGAQAFADIRSGQAHAPKIILKPSQRSGT